MSFDGIGLFIEDFDLPAGHRVERPADGAALAAAAAEREADRARAYAEGVREGAESAAREHAGRIQSMLSACEAQLREADGQAGQMAGEAADEIARLVFQVVATLLPATCARLGAAEVAAFAREMLPLLRNEPELMLHVNPHDRTALDLVLENLAGELRGRVTVRPSDSIGRGDIRISWQDGRAVRSAGELWRSVAAILRPLGLMDEDEAGTRQLQNAHLQSATLGGDQ